MELNIGKQRYVIQWEFVNNEAKTQAFIQEHRPSNLKHLKDYKGHIPLKPAHFIGMAICRIKIPIEPKPEEGRKLDLLCQGYSFRRRPDLSVAYDRSGPIEKTYNKDAARRYALQHALEQGDLRREARSAIWTRFNTLYPPTTPEMNLWKKRYTSIAMENAELRMTLGQMGRELMRLESLLTDRPSDAGPSDVGHTP